MGLDDCVGLRAFISDPGRVWWARLVGYYDVPSRFAIKMYLDALCQFFPTRATSLEEKGESERNKLIGCGLQVQMDLCL